MRSDALQLLDDASRVAVDRARVLGACVAISHGPVLAVGGALTLRLGSRVFDPVSGVELLLFGVLLAGAGLLQALGQAAGLRTCDAGLRGEALPLAAALREAAEDIPRVGVAMTVRASCLGLGALTAGAALPWLATWSGDVVTAAVLDAERPRQALARARRHPQAWVAAQGFHLALLVGVWANLVLVYAAFVGRLVELAPVQMAGALRDLPALVGLGLFALVLVEPVRLATLAAAHRLVVERHEGRDLFVRAG